MHWRRDERGVAVRVIAGTAKGRRLSAPPGDRVRPTTDRTKESLFSALQVEVPRASVVDVYAGSGALGIEALSRGASHATFIERDRRAVEELRRNLEVTGLTDRASVVTADARATLAADPVGAPYDIALLDPPYDVDPRELTAVLAALAVHLSPDARITVELGRRSAPPSWPAGVLAGRTRRYGDTRVYEARRGGETEST